MVGFQDMMKKAQALQAKMGDVEARLETLEVRGTAGGDLVRITLSGKGAVKAVALDPSLLKENEKEVLEDLIAAAFADAKKKMTELTQKEMAEAMGGVQLPPGFKLPSL
jgi:DNA-binding YbaB/EbfC family protein